MSANRKPLTLSKAGLLLCEGEDEVSFFNAWFLELGITNVQVVAYQGKTKLAQFLSDLTKVSGLSQVNRMAIIRDADENATAAQQSVQHAVEAAPASIRSLNPPVFVLPGDGKQGALESLWLASLATDLLAPCIDEFFRCIQSKGWQPSEVFAKNDKAKAQLWIATKDIPNERFGLAAWHGRKETNKPWMSEKWIDFNHPSFAPLKQFLISVFAS